MGRQKGGLSSLGSSEGGGSNLKVSDRSPASSTLLLMVFPLAGSINLPHNRGLMTMNSRFEDTRKGCKKRHPNLRGERTRQYATLLVHKCTFHHPLSYRRTLRCHQSSSRLPVSDRRLPRYPILVVTISRRDLAFPRCVPFSRATHRRGSHICDSLYYGLDSAAMFTRLDLRRLEGRPLHALRRRIADLL